MSESLFISIVLPTYNEKENIILLIERLYSSLMQTNYKYEFIVVDDDSPDLTWKIVQDYAEKHTEVSLLHRTKEKGLTSALNSGIEATKGNIVVWMDCDLSHTPELITVLLDEIIAGADAAIASRFCKGGKDNRDGAYRFQRILSSILCYISTKLLKLKVQDITSGYIAIKSAHVKECLPFKGDYGEYFIDLLCKLSTKNRKIVEVPYIFQNRMYGESKTATNYLGYFTRGIKYLHMIFSHAIRRVFYT